jgi:hypothetical protein
LLEGRPFSIMPGKPFSRELVLKSDRSIIIDSMDSERGRNNGSPQPEWKIEHGSVMMRASIQRITEEEIVYIRKT